MTPHDTSPEQELASAYLDGEVTAVERARVEATPELRALVAAMRDVATMIAAVPVVSDSVRDAAISSALAEFGGVGSNVVSLDSRRRWPSKVLTAAAAVVLVGVVGVTVLQNTDNDKSESSSREADPKLGADTADDAAGAGVPESANGEVLVTMAAPLVIDDTEQLRELTVPLPPTAESPPDADSGATTVAPDSQRVESYNVEALACMDDNQVFLADVIYQGTLAIAVRDTVTGVTEAIDANCTVLASVSP